VYEDKKSLETLELKATLRKHGMLAEEKKEDKKEEKIQEEQQENKKVQEEKKAEKKAEAKEEKKEQAGPQPHKATKKEKGAEPAPPKTGGDE
jgi:hypothetical protein